MSLVNRFGPLRLSVRIDLKDDGGNLPPICAFRNGVEQAEISHEVPLVIISDGVSLRRTNLKSSRDHLRSTRLAAAARQECSIIICLQRGDEPQCRERTTDIRLRA
jgi:hypothetical protein